MYVSTSYRVSSSLYTCWIIKLECHNPIASLNWFTVQTMMRWNMNETWMWMSKCNERFADYIKRARYIFSEIAIPLNQDEDEVESNNYLYLWWTLQAVPDKHISISILVPCRILDCGNQCFSKTKNLVTTLTLITCHPTLTQTRKKSVTIDNRWYIKCQNATNFSWAAKIHVKNQAMMFAYT